VTGLTRLFSLDIEIPKYSDLFLAPDGLTVVIPDYGIYSWNHDTAQFDPFHFTDQEHLGYLCTRLMGNSSHVILTRTRTSEYGTRERVNSVASP